MPILATAYKPELVEREMFAPRKHYADRYTTRHGYKPNHKTTAHRDFRREAVYNLQRGNDGQLASTRYSSATAQDMNRTG